jgi:hypothetical protein
VSTSDSFSVTMSSAPGTELSRAISSVLASGVKAQYMMRIEFCSTNIAHALYSICEVLFEFDGTFISGAREM